MAGAVTGDELLEEIRDALDSPVRDPQRTAFLAQLEQLPLLVSAQFDLSRVFLSVREVHVARAADTCKTLSVGEVDQLPQTRTHKHGKFDWRWEERSVREVAYIEFCHPTLDDIWSDVRACAGGAAAAAVTAAIVAGNLAAAKALFYPTFYACLVSRIGQRASEVELTYRSDKEYGCWKYHCP